MSHVNAALPAAEPAAARKAVASKVANKEPRTRINYGTGESEEKIKKAVDDLFGKTVTLLGKK
eukprot:CAMPEP_0119330848 /NCGR_PEP_ID=MMETSP1333-20130426/79159_1 /TAXON_ID=418940 /ORGANISM="Scyphosphaera apsteinii, Strain RCC1455" /LENGTH=62 /DNA_ID=CAMNT_0007340315 /DNA_START=236 /DNA_END=421 /DNA_ORIENTATION=+